jgi:hypothetical protein
MRNFYGILGMLIVLGYGYADFRGLELGPSHRQTVPQGLRSASHGGYRSFWYSGFHGGK